MPRTPTTNVQPGAWDFQARCPECKAVVVVPITLSSRLTVDSEGGVVRMRVTQQPAEHNCRQPELPDDGDDDQPELELDDDEPAF